MHFIIRFPLDHPFICLCLYGIAAALAFNTTQTLRDSKLAHYVYVLGYITLNLLLARGVAKGGVSGGGGGLAGAMAGALVYVVKLVAQILLGFLFNAVALLYTCDLSLSALLRFVTSDDQLVVRKTYNRAEGAESRGDLDGAAALYREEIQADPADREAHRRLAEVLLKAGKMREAADLFRQVLELSKGADERCVAALRVAEVFQDNLGDVAAAVELYEMILAEYPKTKHAAYARARLEKVGGH